LAKGEITEGLWPVLSPPGRRNHGACFVHCPRDPNEAYEVTHVPERLRGPPTDWGMVTCNNGIPVRFFAPESNAKAERYATDPEYRQSLITKMVWER
jgi:hypothetical protein